MNSDLWDYVASQKPFVKVETFEEVVALVQVGEKKNKNTMNNNGDAIT